jgi:hypothetical protein
MEHISILTLSNTLSSSLRGEMSAAADRGGEYKNTYRSHLIGVSILGRFILILKKNDNPK